MRRMGKTLATLITLIGGISTALASGQNSQNSLPQPGPPPHTSELYAAACRLEIGDIPDFSCADGEIIPITVDGKSVQPIPKMSCDRPSLLDNGQKSDGQCVPNTRLLSLSTPTMQVAVMCRQKYIRGSNDLHFDEIDVVAHSPRSGATCWFHAASDDGGTVDGAYVPSPTKDKVKGYWQPAKKTAEAGCGICHDNDPFMFSPFVGQVWDKMPADPFGPYYQVDLPPPLQIGFSSWPTQSLNPQDNSCLGCHRIGIGSTCHELMQEMTGRTIPKGADAWARHFPGSHGMPPPINLTEAGWDVIYQSSLDQLQSCCNDPSQPICRLRQIPPGP